MTLTARRVVGERSVTPPPQPTFGRATEFDDTFRRLAAERAAYEDLRSDGGDLGERARLQGVLNELRAAVAAVRPVL